MSVSTEVGGFVSSGEDDREIQKPVWGGREAGPRSSGKEQHPVQQRLRRGNGPVGVHVERSQRLPALGNADRGRKGCTPGYCELDSKQEDVGSMLDGVASMQDSEAARCLTPHCSSWRRFADSAAGRARGKNFRPRAGCSDRLNGSRSERCMHFCRPDARARIGRARTRCAPRRSITLSSICLRTRS